MDVHRFIKEVEKKKCIWYPGHQYYHHVSAVSEAWGQVASMFNLTVPGAKQKFKNLRDVYRVEVKKNEFHARTKNEKRRCIWAYFDDMSFLKNTLKIRKIFPRQQAKKPPPKESTEEDEENDEDEDDGILTSSLKLEEPGINPLIDMEEVMFMNSELETTPTFEKERQNEETFHIEMVGSMNGEEEDDTHDLLFFKSLMPYLKKLPQEKKLLFRMNVQQRLYDMVYDNK